MENPITFTPQEIINTILALCGAIITISAAMTIIIKAIDKMRQPNKKQDERLDRLEADIRSINERLQAGNEQFRDDNVRMERIELANKESMKIVIESLQALTAHAIDGNNTEALHSAKKRLDQYLIDKL
jgi:uncharacterized protein YlxW (UPF0749 family)